jgi:hypothetical protein
VVAEAPARGAVFIVTTERCPQILCRLLGLIAQQDRLVARADAVDTRRVLRVMLAVPDIDRNRATIIAGKMRQLVRVRTVKVRIDK